MWIAKLLIATCVGSFVLPAGTADAKPSKSSSSSKSSSAKSTKSKSSSGSKSSKPKCFNACLSDYQHCPGSTGHACVHAKQACDAACKKL